MFANETTSHEEFQRTSLWLLCSFGGFKWFLNLYESGKVFKEELNFLSNKSKMSLIRVQDIANIPNMVQESYYCATPSLQSMFWWW